MTLYAVRNGSSVEQYEKMFEQFQPSIQKGVLYACTFTTSPDYFIKPNIEKETSFNNQELLLIKRYINYLKRFSQVQLGSFIVIEKHKNGYPHIHGFLLLTKHIPYRILKAQWAFQSSIVEIKSDSMYEASHKYFRKDLEMDNEWHAELKEIKKQKAIDYRKMKQQEKTDIIDYYFQEIIKLKDINRIQTETIKQQQRTIKEHQTTIRQLKKLSTTINSHNITKYLNAPN